MPMQPQPEQDKSCLRELSYQRLSPKSLRNGLLVGLVVIKCSGCQGVRSCVISAPSWRPSCRPPACSWAPNSTSHRMRGSPGAASNIEAQRGVGVSVHGAANSASLWRGRAGRINCLLRGSPVHRNARRAATAAVRLGPPALAAACRRPPATARCRSGSGLGRALACIHALPEPCCIVLAWVQGRWL